MTDILPENIIIRINEFANKKVNTIHHEVFRDLFIINDFRILQKEGKHKSEILTALSNKSYNGQCLSEKAIEYIVYTKYKNQC